MSSPHGVAPRSAAEAEATPASPYWLVPVLRAIPALAVGLVITFLEDHSPRVGLLSFGVFALATGAIVAVASARLLSDRVTRGTFIAHGTIAAASGIAALAASGSGLAVLLLIVTIFAALTGVLELYAGLRASGSPLARDWLTVGAFTAIAAIVFVLIPPDSVLATGLIGAYALMLGVYLLIAGLSLKWPSTGSADRKVAP